MGERRSHPRLINLEGLAFGRWTVLHKSTRRLSGCTLWRVVCTCGFQSDVRSNDLRRGVTNGCHSCGTRLVPRPPMTQLEREMRAAATRYRRNEGVRARRRAARESMGGEGLQTEERAP
jgi:hypothetical protein